MLIVCNKKQNRNKVYLNLLACKLGATKSNNLNCFQTLHTLRSWSLIYGDNFLMAAFALYISYGFVGPSYAVGLGCRVRQSQKQASVCVLPFKMWQAIILRTACILYAGRQNIASCTCSYSLREDICSCAWPLISRNYYVSQHRFAPISSRMSNASGSVVPHRADRKLAWCHNNR